MSFKTLKYSSYLYLILPVILFLLGWTKPIISIPFSIALIIAIYLVNKDDEVLDTSKKIISGKLLAIIFVIILIICILAGQGGLFYQSSDHHWRNAIFRDLINQDWPVYYELTDTYLDYYIGHWLVPAGIAKACLFISEEFAWGFGNILLLYWSAIGVTLTFLWIVQGIKQKSKSKIFCALLIFILFSGLDFIGVLNTKNTLNNHIEWWSFSFQYSSMMTQLFWVFNQSISAWLIIMMFLREKSVKNYFLLIILLLPFSPLPFLGAIPLFACNGFRCLFKSIKGKNIKQFLKDVFSVQNIIALICILPIYYFYYSLNQSTTDAGFRLIKEFLTPQWVMNILVFWFLEVGIYGIVLFKNYKKTPIYWVSVVGSIFIPFFALGHNSDFTMRGSIPFLMVVMVLAIDLLMNKFEETKKLIKYALIVLLIIGAMTPGYEFYRAISTVVDSKTIFCVADGIKTFSNKNPAFYTNFLAENSEDSVFVKYLVKNNQRKEE